MCAMPFVPFAFQPPDLLALIGSQIGPFASPTLGWTNPVANAGDLMSTWMTAAANPYAYYLNAWAVLTLAMLGMGSKVHSRQDDPRESSSPVAVSPARSPKQRKVARDKVR
ncbi:hypothetical protein B0E46_10855 [Rhodanobacter sp. B04]|uniref:hypothetical protein n=1 Tax=Rhodanobacter sp. B04 TaxID=1945860 RepID=UPI000985D586|nr:hypothetical protein [Rhodanobacter sp. B04]OOG63475.1 hypothetical protein B0E46_10855 [Rhodanobacter sp. B04]